MKQIGVLSLQGSVVEHVKMLSLFDEVTVCEVRNAEEVERVSGLILPGGESTTLGKLLKEFNLLDPISNKIKRGMPVWGTCAGMILLAKEILGEENVHFGLMDISVKRNAYGGQLDSFKTNCKISEVSETEIPLVFIRAPLVEKVWGKSRVLADYDGKIIAVRQDNMLVTSFHPELTEDLSFHKYFVKMVLQ